MQAVSQFVVRFFDLVEAEGHALLAVVRGEASRVRAAATSMAMGLALLAVAVPIFIAGIGFLAVALMWWLETQVTRPLAACLAGVAILAVGGACLVGFRALAGRSSR